MRLVAQLPSAAVETTRRRVRRKAQQQRRTPSATAVRWTDWVLLIFDATGNRTSPEEGCPINETATRFE
jgi:hypothetical protein